MHDCHNRNNFANHTWAVSCSVDLFVMFLCAFGSVIFLLLLFLMYKLQSINNKNLHKYQVFAVNRTFFMVRHYWSIECKD
jgi:hypothetical protein